MDNYALMDMATDLGYRLAMCGAETYRVEESVKRVMAAYGIDGEAFAIPNCLHVSMETAEGKPLTRMRRIGHHGNDLDAVEKYSNLSRRICLETPEPQVAQKWLEETEQSRRYYKLPLTLLGNVLGAAGFGVLFGGSLTDCAFAGICGLVVGIVNHYMEKLRANQFFRIITASFMMALLAYMAGSTGLTDNSDTVIIGALMILVPGLLFTNALRDIIYGDTNSGINRIVQVLLIAAAIALGTGAALNLTDRIIGVSVSSSTSTHDLLLEAVACFISCIGFFILFNIHGRGGFLCALGGVITWITYRLIQRFDGGEITAYFFATMVAALYSETMARVRKYPAISYLVISVFPLIPGAGTYYATRCLVAGDMLGFGREGRLTIGKAGAMAVGILLISTIFRVISMRNSRKNP